MGGSDFILGVTPDYEKLILPQLRRRTSGVFGLFNRIKDGISPPAGGLMELPSAHLSDNLLASFRGWIGERLPDPSPSTRAFLKSYLDDIGGEALVKGKWPAGGTVVEPGQWFLHVSFSGAGGTAEVSCLLACHWMDIWWREMGGAITDEILLPHGIAPEAGPYEPRSFGIFAPAEDFGYALYLPTGSEINAPGGKSSFMLDGALEDYHSPEETEAVYRRINAQVPPELAAGACLCQMCATSR